MGKVGEFGGKGGGWGGGMQGQDARFDTADKLGVAPGAGKVGGVVGGGNGPQPSRERLWAG